MSDSAYTDFDPEENQQQLREHYYKRAADCGLHGQALAYLKSKPPTE